MGALPPTPCRGYDHVYVYYIRKPLQSALMGAAFILFKHKMGFQRDSVPLAGVWGRSPHYQSVGDTEKKHPTATNQSGLGEREWNEKIIITNRYPA